MRLRKIWSKRKNKIRNKMKEKHKMYEKIDTNMQQLLRRYKNTVMQDAWRYVSIYELKWRYVPDQRTGKRS